MKFFGLYNSAEDCRSNSLYANEEHIMDRTSALIHPFGIRKDDTSVFIDDSPFAKGVKTSEVKDNNSTISIDNVELVTRKNNIPISLDDYNSILNHGLASGQKAYYGKDKYSIEDVYLDEENVETAANFTKGLCPIISLRYGNSRILSGEYLRIPYFVDTHYMDSVNRNILRDTFTVIITVDGNDDNVYYKRTHYAGEYEATIGPITDVGVHWFEIKAIDQDGCCSPSVFFEFIVEERGKNIYDATNSTRFEELNITLGAGANPSDEEACEIEAYKNKIGLSRLFKELKDEGYDGIKFPKDSLLRLSYHINEYRESDRYAPYNLNGKIQLSDIKFYKVKFVENGTDSDGNVKYKYTEVIKLPYTDFYNDCCTKLWTNWSEDKVIWADSTSAAVDNKPLYVLDELYSSYNTRNALVTRQKDPETGNYVVDGNGKYVEIPWTDAEIEAHRLKKPHRTSYIPVVGEQVKPHNSSSGTQRLVDVRDCDVDGYYYLMLTLSVTDGFSTGAAVDGGATFYKQTYRPNIHDVYGDHMVIPDNFEIDLNGTKIKATDHTMRWANGRIIYFVDNTNIVIKNGSIESHFEDFKYNDFKLREFLFTCYCLPCLPTSCYYLAASSGLYKPAKVTLSYNEGLGTVVALGSSHCKLENITLKYLVGFDPTFRARQVVSQYMTPSYIEGTSFADNLVGTPLQYFDKSLLTADDDTAMSITAKATVRSTDQCVSNRSFLVALYKSAESTDYTTKNHYFLLGYDDNDKLIKVIKVIDSNHIKLPSSVVKFRFLVYGKKGAFDDSIYPDGPNCPAAPTLYGLNDCANNLIDRCKIIETRTIAIHIAGSNGTIFRNCVFRAIASTANTHIDWFKKTNYLGDCEEGHGKINKVYLKNCINSHDDYEIGSSTIAVHGFTLLSIDSCKEVGFAHGGLIKNIFVTNSRIPSMQLNYHPDVYNNHIFVRDCVIDHAWGEWYSSASQYNNSKFTHALHKPITEKVIALKNVKINQHIRYNNYNMHNVINGKQRYD